MIANGLAAQWAQLQASLSAFGLDVGTYRLSLYGFLRAIIIAVLLYAFVRLVQRLFKWVLRRNHRLDDTQRLLIEKLFGISLAVLAFLVGVDVIGIDLTALTVFSGAFGLAVGFGFQKTFGNLIAGIILLMDRSIKPGDVIVVGESVGRVARIGVRAVSVVTRDGKKHLVPNELLMTERVENWSYSSRDVRMRVKLGVGYDSDLRLVQRLLLETAREHPRVLAEPEPAAWITAFGDFRVEHELRFWIDDPEAGLGNVQGEIYLALWDKFRAHGVTMPVPQQEVRVRRDDGAGQAPPL